jgi:hypothetical protein
VSCIVNLYYFLHFLVLICFKGMCDSRANRVSPYFKMPNPIAKCGLIYGLIRAIGDQFVFKVY